MSSSLADRLAAGPHARRAGLFAEWPTWLALAGCYALWCVALALASALDATSGADPLAIAALVVVGGYATALHSSLQHEALHGHPTRSRALNEALVWPGLGLFYPYRRFRETHLQHHCDTRLTDPYDDPESYYLAEGDWSALGPAMRRVLRANQSLVGRMALGPWLSAFGVYRADARAYRAGRAAGADGEARARAGRIADAYLRHAPAAAAALGLAWAVFGVSPLVYLLCVAWPGAGLLMLRTFAEHRAVEQVGERTAVVESGPLLSFLFLNNNLHAAHHAHPTLAWYELPAVWRRERAALVAQNGGYVLAGYSEILRRWALRAKEPVAHPFLQRSAGGEMRPGEASARERSDGRRGGRGWSGRRAADVRLAGTACGDGCDLGELGERAPAARPLGAVGADS